MDAGGAVLVLRAGGLWGTHQSGARGGVHDGLGRRPGQSQVFHGSGG